MRRALSTAGRWVWNSTGSVALSYRLPPFASLGSADSVREVDEKEALFFRFLPVMARFRDVTQNVLALTAPWSRRERY